MISPRSVLIYVTVFVFLTVLVFGLNPKGYDFSNHVSRLGESPGIHFGKYGVAYTELDSKLLRRISSLKGFSILMVFRSERLDNNGSGHILTIHPGEDKNQLVIWQWFSYIIAMNDNDYAHRRKTGRVSAEILSSPAQRIFLSLTSGKRGTTLYFDGKAVSSNRTLQLDFPKSGNTTLILGNSAYGNGSWQGDISGLALYDRELPPETITSLYNTWSRKHSFSGAVDEKPFLCYLFNGKNGSNIIDRAGSSSHLKIPSTATPIKKRILTGFVNYLGLSSIWTQDAVINLTGFIPLGFFLAGLIARLYRIPRKRALTYTVGFCFALSLVIELVQAWLPSRTSQSLDLFLNTAGGLIGAFLSNSRIVKRYFPARF